MNQPSSHAIPPSQNTAPVLEFRCLYTQDVRRKGQKRWQDGRLKFHTFNKRVMVYDERSNFVGDMHWQDDSELGEGEELRLERGGIEVQVGECIGKKEQDLTELLDKRVKDREDRVAAKAAIATPTRPHVQYVRPQAPRPSGELPRPKALNAVIGTPTGHYGRAIVPSVSPFEQKQLSIRDEDISERHAKWQKRAESTTTNGGYAQRLIGASLNLGSQKPFGTATVRYEPFRSSIQRPQTMTPENVKGGEIVSGAQQQHIHAASQEEGHPNRAQKKKSYRSPPPRSSYASKLTGAVLSLGPSKSALPSLDELTSKTTTSAIVEATDHRHKRQKNSAAESSFAVREIVGTSTKPLQPPKNLTDVSNKRREVAPRTCSDSFDNGRPDASISIPYLSSGTGDQVQVGRPTSKLQIKPKPPRSLMSTTPRLNSASNPPSGLDSHDNVLKPRKRGAASNLSSPLQVSNGNTSNTSPSNDFIMLHSIPKSGHDAISLSRPTSQLIDDRVSTSKLTSTLRIKARPPRKMMMLMGRPSISSYSLAPKEKYTTDKSCESRQPQAPKAEELPVNHTNGTIDNSLYTMDSKEDHIASSIDSGTGHSTFDGLLFPSQASGEKSRSIRPISKAQIQPENFPQALRAPPVVYTIEQSEKSTAEINLETRIEEKRLETSQISCSISLGSGKGNEPINQDDSRKLEFVSANSTKPPEQANFINQGSSLAIEEIQIAPVLSSEEMPIGSLFDSSKLQLSEVILSKDNKVDDLIPSGSKSIDDTVTNSFHKADFGQQPLGGDHSSQDEATIRTTNAIQVPSDKALLEIRQIKKNQPLARIINPATRGQSIQITAKKTADLQVQNTYNLQRNMPPPPRLTSTLDSRSAPARGFATNRPAAKTALGGGPWSRESFDLFGTWRPSREANASAANG